MSTEVGSNVAALNGVLHHVGVATENARKESEEWQAMFGLTVVSDLIYDPIQQVRVLFLSDGRNGTLLELVEPASPDSPVAAFVNAKSRTYHMCYEVGDLDEALEHIRAQGALVIKPPAAAAAYEGRRIAWCYTRTKNLVELLERRPAPPRA